MLYNVLWYSVTNIYCMRSVTEEAMTNIYCMRSVTEEAMVVILSQTHSQNHTSMEITLVIHSAGCLGKVGYLTLVTWGRRAGKYLVTIYHCTKGYIYALCTHMVNVTQILICFISITFNILVHIQYMSNLGLANLLVFMLYVNLI